MKKKKEMIDANIDIVYRFLLSLSKDQIAVILDRKEWKGLKKYINVRAARRPKPDESEAERHRRITKAEFNAWPKWKQDIITKI